MPNSWGPSLSSRMTGGGHRDLGRNDGGMPALEAGDTARRGADEMAARAAPLREEVAVPYTVCVSLSLACEPPETRSCQVPLSSFS